MSNGGNDRACTVLTGDEVHTYGNFPGRKRSLIENSEYDVHAGDD